MNPQNPIESKNHFYKRWWFWVLLLVLVVGLSVFYLAYRQGHENDKRGQNQGNKSGDSQTGQMSQDQVQKAEAALAKGITLEDGKDDFVTEFGSADYWIPQFDTKSISFGFDDQYLYRKCTYWVSAEKTAPKINGVEGWNMNCTSELFLDTNKDTVTKWGKGTYHMLATNYSYPNSQLGMELFLNLPDGALEEEVDYPGNPYNKKGQFKGLYFGGAGYDYVLAAWPLSDLGIKEGDGITIGINTEVGADPGKVHYAVDVMPNNGRNKTEEKYHFILGQTTDEQVKDDKRGL